MRGRTDERAPVNARGTDVAALDQQSSEVIVNARGTGVAAPDQQSPVADVSGRPEPVSPVPSDNSLPTVTLFALIALGLGGIGFAARLATGRRRSRATARRLLRHHPSGPPRAGRSGLGAARDTAPMDLELTGKVVVVTGASKGIGLAIARELAAEGALVIAGARNVDALHGLDGVTPVAVDLAAPDGPALLVAQAIERHGRVDVLVNNVGAVRPHLDGFLSLTDGDFEAALNLNFFAALRATRAAVADMAARGEGTIVNVGSVNAFFHPDGAVIDYGAAKAALLNLSKALSQELGPQGIRITSVAPGPVATDLWLGEGGVADVIGAATGAGADAIREQATAGMPTGRFTTPREVATIVALLASPRTANVTGADWVIDGGLIKTT